MSKAMRYWTFFAVETAGALVILWMGIPLYRELMLDGRWSPRDLATLSAAMVAVALVQAGHWAGVANFPAVRIPKSNLAGQVILFLGRLNFGLVGGIFASIFYVRYADLELSTPRVVMLVAIMFTMFCFSLDLERIGRCFMEEQKGAGDQADS